MPQTASNLTAISTRILQIILLAFSYALIGRLSVLLAIPPGYATAIFPPAGIALVAILLFGRSMAFGVLLGSVLLNLWIGHDSGTELTAGLPLAIGAGAAIQALLAYYLVCRYVKAPDELTRDTDIILFLLLAGPLACTVNATVGISSLYFTGALDDSGVMFAWFTWWVGDSLGVVISAPLLFILLAPARGVWRKRRWAVGLPLMLMSVGLIWMFIKFSSWEVRQRQFEFSEKVRITQEKLASRFERAVLTLGALERFFTYSDHVSRAEFQGYASFFLHSSEDVRALSWNRYLRQHQRIAFEAQLNTELGLPSILDLNQQRKLINSAEAEQYVVVEYIEPMANNSAAIGFNILSNPANVKALMRARDSGTMTAGKKITLVQSKEDAVLLFYPVYQRQVTTVAQRQQHILGYITGVYALKPLIDNLLTSEDVSGLEMQLLDQSNDNELLMQTAIRPHAIEDNLHRSFNIMVGDRQWKVNYWLSADFRNRTSDFFAFAVLTVGLLFTSILGAFLLVITGRAHHISQLVTKRSAELKGVLDNAIDTILTFDNQGNIDSINPAGEKLLGYQRNDLIGKSVNIILPELERRYLIGSDVQNPLLKSHFDSTVVCQDATEIPVEVALSKMALNNESRFTVILRDLTERNKAEKLKDDIISTVSHELRTPLTSIMGSLGLINSGVVGLLPEKAAQLVSLAMQNSQRLTLLVNDILELSKQQAANYHLTQEPIALDVFLAKAIGLNAGYASQYNIDLVLQPVAAGLMVAGDDVKLMQVMSNLLSNAIKYSPPQGQVRVSATALSDQYVDIAVQDFGSGIPEEFQPQVFQRFSQADSTDTRRLGGTGLGLAIAKIIVEKHQGRIWFNTVPKEGTTFVVRLPLLHT